MKHPAIDVLRGIAAFGVAWFHSRVDLWVGFREIRQNPSEYSWIDREMSWLSLPVSQLGSLVMLFFVLSGFCIHLPLAAKGRTVDLVPYAVRRVFRIYPAYFAVLVFCLFAAWGLSQWSGGTTPNINRYLASFGMLQNWTGTGGQIAMNPSLWSIPVEVELYLVYPILLWIHLRYGIGASVAFTLACTAFGWVFHLFDFTISNGTFFKYAIIWNSGAWLAENYVCQRLPRWTSWHATCLFSLMLITPAAGFAGIDVFYLHYGWGLASFLGLWWLITDGAGYLPEDARWVKAFTALGAVSYSLYLIHFPLLKIAGSIWVATYGSKPASFAVPTLATFAVIPFAWLFYRLFELPSHELGRTLAQRMTNSVNLNEKIRVAGDQVMSQSKQR